MCKMKLITTLLLLTSTNSLNINDCNEIGTYKDKFIFICSQELITPSSSISQNIATPSPSGNVVPSPVTPSPFVNNIPSPSGNVVPSPVTPSPSVNNIPSPSGNNIPSPVFPSPSENVLPSPESTDILYEKINKDDNTVDISQQLNSSNNYTNTTQGIQHTDGFNIGFVLIPLMFLIVIFYHVFRKKSSKIMCDSGKENNLPVIKVSLDDVSEKSNETIPSPPPPPTTTAPPLRPPLRKPPNITPRRTRPTKPPRTHYDIENPPPVPRKNNQSN